MIFTVYDRDLIKIGIVAENVYALWNRKYDSSDTFQITAPLTERYRELLLENNFIKKENDATLGIITTVEYTVREDGKEQIIAQGLEASALLEQRYIEGTYKGKDSIPNHIRNIITLNCIQPENTKRIIPKLDFKFDESIVFDEHPVRNLQASYGNVLKKTEELCKERDLGFNIHYEKGRMVFVLYKGEDKTYSQAKNYPVLFSRSHDNIITQDYLSDNKDYRNFGLVAGQGEGEDRKFVIVGDDSLEGLDRKEIYIDARDVSQEEDVSDAEYIEILKNRGLKRLSEMETIQTLEGQVNIHSNLRYKEDFNLGDLVVIEDDRWNLTLETRIIEIEEVYEEYFDIRLSFGNKIPNLLDDIRDIKESQTSSGGYSQTGAPGAPGEDGKPGKNGVGLDYDWRNTELGIKREDEQRYTYVELKGEQGTRGPKGETGPPGKDGTDATVTKDKIIGELGYTPADKVELPKYLRKDGSDTEFTLGKGNQFESNFKNDNWSFINNYTGGGWARGLLNIKNKEGDNYFQIGGNGGGQNFTMLYMGRAWNDWNLSINPNSNTVDVKNTLRVNNKEVAIKEDIPGKLSLLENDTNFITKESVPDKLSLLENDAGFITKEDIPEASTDMKDEETKEDYKMIMKGGKPYLRKI